MIKKYKSVGVYARVSTDKQKVDMQLQELSDFIKRSGWKLYKKYVDHGYTGANTQRPDFSKMMIDARQRKFDTNETGSALKPHNCDVDMNGALAV